MGEIGRDDSFSLRSVKARLLGLFRSPVYRPPVLPTVALELRALSRNCTVRLNEVLALLEKDSLIAGEVLKLAQSSYYQRHGRVRTLEQAVTRLGLQTLSDLCLHASLTARVFRAPGYEQAMNDLRRHSALTAHICRLASSHSHFPTDYAYTCGLLHDVGVAACLSVIGEGTRNTSRPPLREVVYAIRDVHQEAGATLTTLWDLPDDIRLVISKHHSPIMQDRIHPLVATLVLSEAIAHDLGFGGMGDVNPWELPAAADLVGISADALDRLRRASEHAALDID